MKNWLLPLLISVLLATPLAAQDDEAIDDPEFEDPALLPVPDEPSAAEREAAAAAQQSGLRTGRTGGAHLRGLDKITGKTIDINMVNGQTFTYGRLELLLGDCRFPQDDPDSDAFAALTITDTSRNMLVFSGWMIASSPALSALDDARYDVWVISCNSA